MSAVNVPTEYEVFPFPWSIGKHSSTSIVAANGNGVASCGGFYNNKLDPGKLFAEQERIARLIAAAPELLEALERISAIQDKYDGGDWDEINEAREIAFAALEKIRG
jgi:hypothetical protein